MDALDFILNLAGLLLWLNWRMLRVAALPIPAAISLMRTLRRAETSSPSRFRYIVALLLLLLIRGLVYQQLGSALHWVPRLQLGVVTISFRNDYIGQMLLFSFSSFGLFVGIFHFWLLFLSIINASIPDTDAWQRLVRVNLGRCEQWPWWSKWMIPGMAAAIAWWLLLPAFVRLGLFQPPRSMLHGIEQGVVFGFAAYLTWKYLIIGILLLHVLSSYVYFGDAPFWRFVDASARHLIAPFRAFPLRWGRLDLVPLALIPLVWALVWIAWKGLERLFFHLPIP